LRRAGAVLGESRRTVAEVGEQIRRSQELRRQSRDLCRQSRLDREAWAAWVARVADRARLQRG
jgi:hypothetical protein